VTIGHRESDHWPGRPPGSRMMLKPEVHRAAIGGWDMGGAVAELRWTDSGADWTWPAGRFDNRHHFVKLEPCEGPASRRESDVERSGSNRRYSWVLNGFGLGALFIGASTIVVTLVIISMIMAPIAVWVAWDLLHFGRAIGAPELGLWGVILLTLFLVSGFGGRLLLSLLVWAFDPGWLHASATLQWPQGSFRTFVALVILLLVAQTPVRARRHRTPLAVE
jgi:hypothetical protein